MIVQWQYGKIMASTLMQSDRLIKYRFDNESIKEGKIESLYSKENVDKIMNGNKLVLKFSYESILNKDEPVWSDYSSTFRLNGTMKAFSPVIKQCEPFD